MNVLKISIAFNKMFVIRAGSHKMLDRMVIRDDLDQKSVLFVWGFLAGNSCLKFEKISYTHSLSVQNS